MSKHTPGPWVFQAHDHWLPAVVIGESVWHAGLVTGRERPGEHEANARLIAAAPDLLAALKALLPWVAAPPSDSAEAWRAAQAAIAKAEGES